MTIVHVVIVKFQQPLSELEAAAITAAAYAMKDTISIIRSLKCGCDLGFGGPSRLSYSLTAEFDTMDDYKQYAAHPVHVAFVDTHIKPFMAPNGRTAIQFEI
mgnify:CR=1 FL=1